MEEKEIKFKLKLSEFGQLTEIAEEDGRDTPDSLVKGWTLANLRAISDAKSKARSQ